VVQRALETDRLPLERAVVVGEHLLREAQVSLEQAEPLRVEG
jgi:exonuclease VII small subunit